MNSIRGSTTVEAAIIYPLVIMVLLALVFFIVGLYRQVDILTVVNLAAEEGALQIQSGISAGASSKVPLYTLPSANELKESLKKQGLADTPLLTKGGYLNDSSVVLENKFFYKKIIVSVEKSYATGVSFIDSILGSAEDGFTVYVKNESVVLDPAEFIRNVDMAADMTDKIPGMSGFKQKYNGLLEKIKNNITSFFSEEE
jgi:hypothetical protein